MKKLLSLFIISNLVLSCGGSGGSETPDPPKENNKPSVPTTIYPSVNSLCIENSVNFQWNSSSDRDGDAIKYNLQIALDNQFSQIAHDIKSISGTSKTVSLEKGVAYYWKVNAVDSKNASSDFSNKVQFYTEGEGEENHIPFSPELVAPELNDVLSTTSVTLEWKASDVDNDALTYDVYFGTDKNNLSIVSEKQSDITHTESISGGLDYYWKIVVFDGNGGSSIGQIWNFQTD